MPVCASSQPLVLLAGSSQGSDGDGPHPRRGQSAETIRYSYIPPLANPRGWLPRVLPLGSPEGHPARCPHSCGEPAAMSKAEVQRARLDLPWPETEPNLGQASSFPSSLPSFLPFSLPPFPLSTFLFHSGNEWAGMAVEWVRRAGARFCKLTGVNVAHVSAVL